MKLPLLFAGLLISFGVQAQLKCGNPNEDRHFENERNARLSQLTATQRQVNNTPVGIPVKMHLFTNNDGTTALSQAELNDALAELNRVYQPSGMVFYFAGTTFNSYANSNMNQALLSSQQETNFHSANGVSNAINVYVASVVKLDGEEVGGWSFMTPNIQSANRMFLKKSQVNDDKTMAHEFGHYFNLLHTFNNSTDATLSNRELVTRNFNESAPRISANCDDNGDYLCDTPSDPYPINDESNYCNYTGADRDLNNDLFSPQVNNYMDYRFCWPYQFTAGQWERIATGRNLVLNASGFNLNAAPTTQPVPTQVVATIDNYDILVSWNDVSTLETGYIIERSTTNSGPFTPIGGVARNSTSFRDNTTETGINYFYRIKASNTWNSYSQVSAAITAPICGNQSGQTCQLNPGNDANWNIEYFRLFTPTLNLIENANSGCSVNGIGNYFNSIEGLITPGQNVQFNVRSKQSSEQLAYNIRARIWVDWNRNNVFEASERMYSSVNPTHYQVSGSFVIPQNIEVGSYRMRVGISAQTELESCGVDFGEFEDYRLTYTPLSLQNNLVETIQIYPNPTSDFIRINSVEKIQLVKIFDLSGKEILSVNNPSEMIDLRTISTGIYLLKATSANATLSHKIIKE